jgi:hypothetical protein
LLKICKTVYSSFNLSKGGFIYGYELTVEKNNVGTMICLAFKAYRRAGSCSEIGCQATWSFSEGQVLEYHAGGRRLPRNPRKTPSEQMQGMLNLISIKFSDMVPETI